jgi:hypothetical protein
LALDPPEQRRQIAKHAAVIVGNKMRARNSVILLSLLGLPHLAQAQEAFIPSPTAQYYITWFSKGAATQGIDPSETAARCYIQASAIIGTSACVKQPDVNAVFNACQGAEEEALRKAQATSHFKSEFSDRLIMTMATEEMRKNWKPLVLAWLVIIQVERCDAKGDHHSPKR